jgi:hypothetical protein
MFPRERCTEIIRKSNSLKDSLALEELEIYNGKLNYDGMIGITVTSTRTTYNKTSIYVKKYLFRVDEVQKQDCQVTTGFQPMYYAKLIKRNPCVIYFCTNPSPPLPPNVRNLIILK